MPRAPKNQWDFGDLFAAPAQPQPKPAPEASPEPTRPVVEAAPTVSRVVLSVTELTSGIRRQLEQSFGSVWVAGEISNLRLQPSGHAYFVLKDASAQINCVAFRGQGGKERSRLKDGMKVTLGGELTVYEPRGQYQLRVTAIELEGIGALQAAFERLKAKLQAEGLFDPDRKRPLPPFPRRVGLVTSPTGAAIRDILHVAGRRYAGLEWVLVPVRVQGEGAAEEIARAIEHLNQWAAPSSDDPTSGPKLDVILVTRGGGSLEDLWAFNEEVVARALASSAIPTLSAVGHEIDFTIADFAADARAATPSAAAEMLTAKYVASADRVNEISRRLRWLMARILQTRLDQVDSLRAQLARRHPRRSLETRAQHLDDLCVDLSRRVRQRLREAQQRAQTSRRRLLDRRPAALLDQRRTWIADLRRRLMVGTRHQVQRVGQRFDRLQRALELLSPISVLSRGYSLTLDPATGRVIRRPEEAPPGTRIRSRLAEGELASVVIETPRVSQSADDVK